jgi:hypothetical protein
MRTIPEPDAGFLEFVESRLDEWLADPASIGLTTLQVVALSEQVEAARVAYQAAEAARAASKAATVTLRNAMDAARTTAGAMVRVVRAFADISGNPDVYATAQIAPPSPPSPPAAPSKAPAQPTGLAAGLEPTGAITIRWRNGRRGGGQAPGATRGVVYAVSRRLPGERSFSIIGTVAASRGRGVTQFTDTAAPAEALAGGQGIEYTVRGLRAAAGTRLAGPESMVLTVVAGSPSLRMPSAA